MSLDFGAPVAHPFEKWLLRKHAANVLAHGRGARTRMSVARWFVENRARVGLPAALFAGVKINHDALVVDRPTQRRFEEARAILSRATQAPAPSRLQQRLDWLAEAMRLGDMDRAIVAAMARATLSAPTRELIQRLVMTDSRVWYCEEADFGAIAALTGLSQPRARQRLGAGAPLIDFGIVEDRDDNDFALSRRILQLLNGGKHSEAALRATLIGRPQKTRMKWADFAHVPQADNAAAILRAALDAKAGGVNILLYGPPGVGKSEFARALAARIGAQAIFCGEDGANGQVEPDRAQRVGAIAMTGVLARRAGDCFAVVDEADDIFAGVDDAQGAMRRGSKAFVHRLVDECEAPTVWIVNNVERCGPAVVRRMTLALRFSAPGRALREKIVDRLARRARVPLDSTQRERMTRIGATPALVANAMRAGALAGRDGAVALQSAEGVARALEIAPADAPAAPLPFTREALRANIDLEELERQVRLAPTRALSFLFHGAPGAGKSLFARKLAEALELDVIEKRASDLMSMWIGQTEKNIRAAFDEAQDTGAFLIFDEADSLLLSREGAQRSWEVAQVNEMLVCMERAAHPFACTTNAFSALDPAALRRFLFKAEFLPMEAAQIDAAFRAAFGAAAPAALLAERNLTAGDFAVVARKARLMGVSEGARLTQWLLEEVAAKPGRSSRIGF